MNRQELLKTAKPIIFNTDMVIKILKGIKTNTGRPIKVQAYIQQLRDGRFEASWDGGFDNKVKYIKPKYQVGDILYVRETWTELCNVDEHGYTHYDECNYYYIADGIPTIDLYDDDGFLLDDQRIKWKPSIHMPKEAARLFLKVVDVKAQMLKETTVEQAHKEGFDTLQEFIEKYLKIYPNKTVEDYLFMYEFERIEICQ